MDSAERLARLDYERAIAYATERGTRSGTAAASWYEMSSIGGSAPDRLVYDASGRIVDSAIASAARAILAGLESGDPAILDTLPYADLSGQWADTLTGPDLVRDTLVHIGARHCDGSTDPDPFGHEPGACNICDWYDATGDICDAYAFAFDVAAQDAIESAARAIIA